MRNTPPGKRSLPLTVSSEGFILSAPKKGSPFHNALTSEEKAHQDLLALPLSLELEYPHDALPEIVMQNTGRISAQMEV